MLGLAIYFFVEFNIPGLENNTSEDTPRRDKGALCVCCFKILLVSLDFAENVSSPTIRKPNVCNVKVFPLPQKKKQQSGNIK